MILVGEMRDLETIQTALTAAETGHLVFATLHTQDAPQSIDRIIDVFPAHQQQQIRVQLAASLQGICTQQLLQTAGRARPRARGRGARRHAGGPQPHPGGEDLPDLLADADRREVRDGHDGPAPRAARERPARSRSRPRSSGARTRRTSAGSRSSSRSWAGLMPTTFAYKVRDQGGKIVEGQLEAEDADARRRQAPPDGLHADRGRGQARQQAQGRHQDPGPLGPGEAEGRRGLLAPVRDDDQLGSLADPVARDPRRADREPGARDASSARCASTSSRASSLSAAISRHPKVFSRLYIAMVQSGEAGGVLDAVLMRLADTIEKQVELRRKIRSAMTYPIVVLGDLSADRDRDAAVHRAAVQGDLRRPRRARCRCRPGS